MIYKGKYNEFTKYRQNILSVFDIKTFIIVCRAEEIEKAVASFKQFKDKSIEKICITPVCNRENLCASYENIPVEYIEVNLTAQNLAVFIPEHSDLSWIASLSYISSKLDKTYYYYENENTNFEYIMTSQPYEYFYKVNKQYIDKAYKKLADKKSKRIFLERLKCYIEGEADYLRCEPDSLYFPNKFSPVVKYGSIVIDAGISDITTDVETYSKLAGRAGKVYAFEASPIEFEKSKKNIDNNQNINNVELINLGLWNTEKTSKISITGGSSSLVYNPPGDYIDCKLTSLDKYVEQNNLPSVDYIKLDIEGAEIEALKGAKNSIKKYKPNMAISISHFPVHLWSIILYIDSLGVNYKYYIYNHGAIYSNTILYCIYEKQNIFQKIWSKLKIR